MIDPFIIWINITPASVLLPPFRIIPPSLRTSLSKRAFPFPDFSHQSSRSPQHWRHDAHGFATFIRCTWIWTYRKLSVFASPGQRWALQTSLSGKDMQNACSDAVLVANKQLLFLPGHVWFFSSCYNDMFVSEGFNTRLCLQSRPFGNMLNTTVSSRYKDQDVKWSLRYAVTSVCCSCWVWSVWTYMSPPYEFASYYLKAWGFI